MSGLLMERPFVAVFPELVRTLGSMPAAAVLQFIAYAERDDEGAVLKVADIAAGTGLNERTVKRLTMKLRDDGLLDGERADTWCSTVRYSINRSHPALALSESDKLAPSESAEVALSPSDSEVEVEDQEPADEQGALSLFTVPRLSAATPAVVGTDPVEAEFGRFWDLYPRKVGKKAALASYRRARKRASVEEIAAGLIAQLPALRAREVAYVPHPQTWLNQGRWTDDPRAVTGSSRPRNFEAEMMVARATGNAAADEHGLPAPAALALQMMGGQR